MANLKIDLQNKIRNDKYFSEIELVRLANDPNMNYKQKIDEMSRLINDIALNDAQLELSEKYFQEPTQAQGDDGKGDTSQNPPQPNKQNVHNGQTHGE